MKEGNNDTLEEGDGWEEHDGKGGERDESGSGAGDEEERTMEREWEMKTTSW